MSSLSPSDPSSRFRGPCLFVISDLFIMSAGLLLGHKALSGRWLLPETMEESLAILAVLGLYIAALAAGGGYTETLNHEPSKNAFYLGVPLLGAWGLILALPLLRPSLPFSLSTLLVQGLVTLVGVPGCRALFSRLPPPPHQQPLSSEATSKKEPHPPRPPSPNGAADPLPPLSDLIPRDSVEISRSALHDLLSDQTVLVTGAGGSIGTELSTQLLTLDPGRLVLLDMNEHNLYRLENTLRARSPDPALKMCLTDIRDTPEMDRLLAREQPDVVFHTAAYKHVPLLERHPAEAFRNNTDATAGLVRLCEQHDVDHFVFVSTDKAVSPKSILGATKQWAEWYVRTARSSLKSTTVRFGNVYGSQGSVARRFENKLAAGESLPVTHPEMERYFMSEDEACRLLLETLLLDAHPIYLLRMGEPVRIQWLAEQLIERLHPQVDPASMIEYIGPRPGEKFSEQLVRAEESVHPTEHPNIRGLDAPPPYNRETLDSHFQDLRTLCDPTNDSVARLRRSLLQTQPRASAPMT